MIDSAQKPERTIMVLEIEDVTPVTLSAYIHTDSSLRIRYLTVDLSAHEDYARARSSDPSVRFELAQAEGLQISAEHEDENGRMVPWSPYEKGVYCVVAVPTSDPLLVAVTSTDPASGESKKVNVYVDAKPKSGLPDRP
jgi:hypothetical protein